MLYPKSKEAQLSEELFRNPTCEYRGTPFWAWNGELEKDELLRQIEFFKKMGLGGFHMHVRSGMATRYLSDEFMALIRACVDKAKEEEMLAWLYDEDRWPSGIAGGFATHNRDNCQRRLLMTANPYAVQPGNVLTREDDVQEGGLLACFDVVLNERGELESARRIPEAEEAKGRKWYAYVTIAPKTPRYNNESYLDLMNKKAVDDFIALTYDRYAQVVGDEFGKTVPAIFTDEPQFGVKETMSYADAVKDVYLPWTDDLPETFRTAYGEELVENLPQLFWDLPNGAPSQIRYHYHDHTAQRFTESFSDNVGEWCDAHGIAFTGHMMGEPTLFSQTRWTGESMRSYRKFAIPGIDMLCSNKEFTTAKQAQSAVHQYGREGMMSELYGVTGWTFDFRGHKLNGDWQAAMGVTVRVPHLSWYTMKGEAKRDYPASIHYQSSWGAEYGLVEDHFARVNTALTRGTPVVRVGVIHPVESYWLHWGPSEQTAAIRDQLNENFENVTEWLVTGSIDFDYICESLLPEQCAAGGAPLQVGKMAYDVVIVPECETLRTTTLERLEQFRDAGGKLIFLGKAPTLADAVPSARGKQLFDRSEQVRFARTALLEALEDVRELDIRSADTGSRTDNLVHQLREDNGTRWLFIAHAFEPYNPDVTNKQNIRIVLRGEYKPELYNTQTGDIEKVAYFAENGKTILEMPLYDYDSLLLHLTPGTGALAIGRRRVRETTQLTLPAAVDYTLSEPNVLLLDTAEVAVDGGAFEPEEEMLKAYKVCCEKLQMDWENAHLVQPWAYDKPKTEHTATLRFTVHSKINVTGARFALENADRSQIRVNGMPVPMMIEGYYTDHCLGTVPLPELKPGTTVIEVDTPIDETTGLEWCYLLGDFGVQLNGRAKTLVEMPEKLGFGPLTMQQLPFYGAAVTYQIPFSTKGGPLTVQIPHYRGALVRVSVDGRDCGPVIYSPYRLELGVLQPGEHRMDITVYCSRENSFGPVHYADGKDNWIGPKAWRPEPEKWTYEYRLAEMGLLSSPVLSEGK